MRTWSNGPGPFRGLACLAMMAMTTAMAPAQSESESGVRVLRAGEPTVLCVPPSSPDLSDLQSGRRRAVLVVHALEVPDDGRASLRVSLAATDGKSRIGFFPAGDFGAASGDEARRYFLPSAEGVEPGEICYEVVFDAEDGAEAKVSLEISEALDR